MKHQVPPRPWMKPTETSRHLVHDVERKQRHSGIILCCPACFTPHPHTALLKTCIAKNTWSWTSQKNLATRPPSIQVRKCPDQWVVTNCCWLGPVWATQFLPLYFLLIFFTWNTAFTKAYFSFYTFFSISSLHCLLASHSKLIKTQFRNQSILRSSDENSLPGQFTAGQPWLSSPQGTLAPIVAMGTCRRHGLSSHKSLAVHTL